jgi:hypothetical protein
VAEIDQTEIKNLARALVHGFGRHWVTMPAEAQRDDDENGGQKAWLARARAILEAVDRAMILELSKTRPKRS